MGHPRFKQILAEMQEVHDAKSAEYSGEDPLGNWREAAEIGIHPFKGAAARLTEKYSRWKQLMRSLRDDPPAMREALRDMAVYCIITRILYEENQEAKS